MTGCGKSGPPLPPLVKVPAPPGDLLAERRGDAVDLQFTVPNTNTDGSRPANVDRVEVYAITTAATMTDDEIIKHGTRVATVDVKAPRDPNRTVAPEDAEAEIEPPEGTGLDQGGVARVAESLDGQARVPLDLPREEHRKDNRRRVDEGPLLGPGTAPLSRTYLVVGFSTRGRKGPPSKRASVPLVPAPPAPEQPSIVYNEGAVTVTWPPVALSGMVQQPDSADVLPSIPIGVPLPTVAYHVYDVSSPDAAGPPDKLTVIPVAVPKFEDPRMTWDTRRCYTVRAVETMNNLAIEGDAAEARCTTLTDTFAPAAPKGLQAVANQGSISLIWDPNGEKDLAGYLVFRGTEAAAPQPITPSPIEQAMFNDAVGPGVQYTYVVKAVDKAGNVSAPSSQVQGSAR
jgi:hypothetical protein